MATGGWGGAAGAWGPAPVTSPEEVDVDDGDGPSPYAPPKATNGLPAYGVSAPAPGYGGAAPDYAASSSRKPEPVSFETQAPSAALVNREAEVKRKEAALAMKERELKAMEERLKASGLNLEPPANWPICWPWIYHNISGDIPEGDARRVVREGYMAWWGLTWCLLWNFICASAILGTGGGGAKLSSWFLAVLYAVVGIPGGFFIWYRILYRGAKNDSSFSMLLFFCMFAVHTAFCTWAAIAVPFSYEYWSFAGFVTAVKAIEANTGVGVIYFIGASFWTLEALFSFWLMKDVFFFFKGKGGAAQEQATLDAETAENGGTR